MTVVIHTVHGNPREGYRARVSVFRKRWFLFGPLVFVRAEWVPCPQPQRRLTQLVP